MTVFVTLPDRIDVCQFYGDNCDAIQINHLVLQFQRSAHCRQVIEGLVQLQARLEHEEEARAKSGEEDDDEGGMYPHEPSDN